MSGNTYPSPQEVWDGYYTRIIDQIESGKAKPWIHPYHLLAPFIVIFYLSLPHTTRPWLYSARWLVVGAVIMLATRALTESECPNVAVAEGLGLLASWTVFQSLALLVFTRPQWEAKRIERKRYPRVGLSKAQDGAILESSSGSDSHDRIRLKRPRANGSMTEKAAINKSIPKDPDGVQARNNQTPVPITTGEIIDEDWTYYWQAYPTTFRERLSWSFDLFSNMRGMGWNTRIRTLPDPPAAICAQLGDISLDESSTTLKSSVGVRRYTSRADVFYRTVPRFFFGWLAVDAMKLFALQDPYFYLGPGTYDLPPHLQLLSGWQLDLYRKALSFFTIIVCIDEFCLFVPIGMCLILGPEVLGVRGEAWMYAQFWGSPGAILQKGLRGLWGEWWHQSFRYIFSAPVNYLVRLGFIKPKSTAKQLADLFIAFGISGILHAAGSMMLFPPTKPWLDTAFFISQAIGICVQISLCELLKPMIEPLPKAIHGTGNLTFTIFWLYITAWMFLDDLCRGGIWLFDPFPISPMRALGFGGEDDHWWVWSKPDFKWHRGAHWWDIGMMY